MNITQSQMAFKAGMSLSFIKKRLKLPGAPKPLLSSMVNTYNYGTRTPYLYSTLEVDLWFETLNLPKPSHK